ncbi:MAG: DUF6508 domain-containing protein [Candidatus Micrarchaeota archaeon]
MDQKFKEIKPGCVARVLEYLPYFEKKNHKFYKMNFNLSAQPYIYSDKVLDFVRTLKDCKFVQPDAFDAVFWGNEAEKILTNESLLMQVDLETIVKLFTAIVVKERTTNGNLALLLSNNTIVHILKRLQNLQ